MLASFPTLTLARTRDVNSLSGTRQDVEEAQTRTRCQQGTSWHHHAVPPFIAHAGAAAN